MNVNLELRAGMDLFCIFSIRVCNIFHYLPDSTTELLLCFKAAQICHTFQNVNKHL